METRHFKDQSISLLGFGLMRLPRMAGGAPQAAPGPPPIDFAVAEALVDHAIANGVNYFDTAYVYGGSEAFAGQALAKHPRDSYFLTTKVPHGMVKSEADFERIFAESLERCQTEYFDAYLVHNVAQPAGRAPGEDGFFETFVKSGIYNMMQKKKTEGKVRNIGFSFHGTPDLLMQMVENFSWDIVQIQLNYVDWKTTAAKEQYEILTSHGISVVVMEPLRGGVLATLNDPSAKLLKDADPEASLASWGIRFAASLPNVMTVLSGMNAMEQMVDNLATVSGFRPVSEEEKALLDQVVAAYNQSGTIPCTGCAYCAPCPQGVDIPRIFSIYNHYCLVKSRIPFSNSYNSLHDGNNASACIQCGECTAKCPQHIDIPAFMKEIDDFAKSPPGPPR